MMVWWREKKDSVDRGPNLVRARREINIGREIHESLLLQKRMFTRGARPIVSLGDVCVVAVTMAAHTSSMDS